MTKSKKTNKKSKIQFSVDKSQNEVGHNITVDYLTENITNNAKEMLQKAVKPETVRPNLVKKNDNNRIVFSTKQIAKTNEGIEQKGWKRIHDHELKEIAQIDPYIAAIISTRCSQAFSVGQESDSKFDKGTRIIDINPLKRDDFNSQEEFKKHAIIKSKQAKAILQWVLNCGTTDEAVLDSAYYQSSDKTFKKCNFSEYLTAQIRNLLTFGRCATQIFRNEETGEVLFFRPAPVETIYHAYHDTKLNLTTREESSPQSHEELEEWNDLDIGEKPIAYVQRIESQNVNFFTEDNMKISYFQKQALFELNGYPLSPIEQAIYMVFIHQNTLGYLRNQFVKGIGSKGILTLTTADPSSELSPEELDGLRREFHNYVNRNDNSSTVPVFAGPLTVNFVPLSTSPKDMEFLQVEEHVVRSLCSAMMISPQEMGYGHLSINQGGLTSANKQEDIVKGEERGLRTILDVIFQTVNDIAFDSFDKTNISFKITYTGVGDDTKDTLLNRQISEMQTTATMNSLYADSEKKESIPIGGDIPLSSIFHANVAKYMFYGDFLEYFMKIKGASKKPEFRFIIDPALNQSYQQKIMMTDEMTRDQGILELQGQKQQIDAMDQQAEMMQQQAANPDQEKGQDGELEAQENSEEPMQEEAQATPEEMPKSLEQAYLERDKLSKSFKKYFSSWIQYNEDENN